MSHLVAWAWLLVTISAPTPPPSQKVIDQTIAWYETTHKHIEFEGVDDNKATLQDVLDHFKTAYKLNFIINTKAFEKLGVNDIGEALISDKLPLGGMRDVTIDALLQIVLSRLPVEKSQATYTVRSYGYEITTLAAQREEFYPKGYRGEFYPLVVTQFAETSLDTASNVLSQQGKIAVVLDRSVLAKGIPRATALFMNVPADTAVKLLAESVNLRAVRVGKSFLLTSPEKAKQVEQWVNPPAKGG